MTSIYGPAPKPSVTSPTYRQRGNRQVMALLWNGENREEIEEFIRTRHPDPEHLEFFRTERGDLLVHHSLYIKTYVVVKGVWVMDQWRGDEETRKYHIRWLVCEPARFAWLYEEEELR